MFELPPIASDWLAGVISGFLLSIPVGPINITIINEGARRGFRWALFIGLGAVLMDSIYCAIAFAGFSAFLNRAFVKETLELLSFLFLSYLGVKYLLARTIPEHVRTADKIEEKLHPHSAFMTGFVRVLGNPAVLLLWTTIAAAFLAHEWVGETFRAKMMCVGGVATGGAIWFFTLSYLVSLGHRRLSEKTLLRMEHFSGAALLGAAVWVGARIIWQLAKNH